MCIHGLLIALLNYLGFRCSYPRGLNCEKEGRICAEAFFLLLCRRRISEVLEIGEQMLEARSLKKAVVPSTLIEYPSPANLQSDRVSLHVSDDGTS
ncbi:hypothetical protein LXL04_024605 [Taraxacum kok-saghyz]